MHSPIRSFKCQQVPSVLFALLLCGISLVFSTQATLAKSSVLGHIGALSSHTSKNRWHGNSAPNDAACLSRPTDPSPCYSPTELEKAYDVTPLLQGGINGKGQTIVIIDSFGSPTALQDLKSSMLTMVCQTHRLSSSLLRLARCRLIQTIVIRRVGRKRHRWIFNGPTQWPREPVSLS